MIGFVLAISAALAPVSPGLREQSFTTLAALPTEARQEAASELAQAFARRDECGSARRALSIGGAESIADNDLRNIMWSAARGSDRACASALADLRVAQTRVLHSDDRAGLGDALMFAGAVRIRIGEIEAAQALVAAREAAIGAAGEAPKDPAGAEADRKLARLIAALGGGSEPPELAARAYLMGKRENGLQLVEWVTRLPGPIAPDLRIEIATLYAKLDAPDRAAAILQTITGAANRMPVLLAMVRFTGAGGRNAG